MRRLNHIFINVMLHVWEELYVQSEREGEKKVSSPITENASLNEF
jgi:hypothetical protein